MWLKKYFLKKLQKEERREGKGGRKREQERRAIGESIVAKILLSLSMINKGKVILAFCFHLNPLL